MAMSANQVRDRKTGRVRRKDPTRVRAAKRGAMKRRGHKLTGAEKMAIAKGVRRVVRSGRTSTGRRSLIGR